jgi:hypothetical protein
MVGILKNKLTKKLAGDSQIVVALVLIAVAVFLCILFKNQIVDIMNNLFNQISGKIESLMNSGV